MALTDTKIRNLKPKEKPYKVADGKGLYIFIGKTSKLWKLKYRYNGTEQKASYGSYPEISLAEARRKRDEDRNLLAEGINPALQKKETQLINKLSSDNTFELVALEWHKKNKANWTTEHGNRILSRLTKDIFPWLGQFPIAQIKAPQLLAVLERIQKRGAVETAHRALQNCSQVFRYAVITGRTESDITLNLRGALQPFRTKNHASLIEPKAISHLLRAIDGYHGHFVTQCALKLSPLFFVRAVAYKNKQTLLTIPILGIIIPI